MAKLHLQQNFSNKFRPLQLLPVAPLHCQDAEHFFAEFSAGKTDHFFGGKISRTTRGSVNGGKLAHFSLDFWPKIRWILSPFPLRKATFSSQTPLGSQAWSCHFFLSCCALLTALTTSNSCCEEKPVVHRCSAPPAPLVDFAISRFVVWLFLP